MNIKCILGLIVRPIRSYKTSCFPCTYSQPAKLQVATLRSSLTYREMPLARFGRPWAFKFYLHIQPIRLPLPSFMMCRFSVSTYPVNFSLSMSHRLKQSTSANKDKWSVICFVTGTNWYNPSFRIIRSISHL